ncbi:MAG TPA: hypothetical protein VEV45_13075 [Streptosporangiaceae bacterium]|nr:hypothetical protein [Streptosporangiaceae bacterium]
MYPPLPDRPGVGSRAGRHRRRFAVFTVLLVVGLAGLAATAVGIAHGVLPRQFTAAQRRQISTWEMERRWRALPAGKIFPASVSYTVPAGDLNASSDLTLQAQRLAISPAASCTGAFAPAAGRVLVQHGCSTVLRATYLDASGSMVATIAVAVLPSSSAASAAYGGLPGTAAGTPGPAGAFPVPGTPAAGFGDADRQLSSGIAAGPYVIVSTAGFSDDRTQRLSPANYVSQEMDSLANGLVTAVQKVLGRPPPRPVCPGAPGC